MAKYRHSLPQLNGKPFLTEGGMETTIVFHKGIDLPHFASFVLLQTDEGRAQLRDYYSPYLDIAKRHGTGFIMDTCTWRASSDWGARMGLDAAAINAINHASVEVLQDIRAEQETEQVKLVISGTVGPRGDGYVAGEAMTPEEAEAYHLPQIRALSEAGADMISAITMTNMPEAVGITRAARACGMPVVISFTVETDGKLPTGQTMKDAIEGVDASTDNAPVYFMINCAHPTHFRDAFEKDESWLTRVRGIRANASTLSHAELDEATQLDDGNPVELGQQYRDLSSIIGNMVVYGGCCGTDHRHVDAIHQACAA